MKDFEQLKNDFYNGIIKEYDSSQEKVSGRDYLNYAGAIYNHSEIISMFNSILDGWFGLGKHALDFEDKFALYHNLRHALVTNSGSSANLLAISSICSPKLEHRCMKGDEIITPASTFPTTLNPILQNQLKPVFIDVELGTYNIDVSLIKQAISKQTKGIFIPHVLGNPNQMDVIMDIAQEHDLFVIEDCCDALGSRFDGKKVGSFGDFGTFSFYAAHHMTMGEGGAIVTNDTKLRNIAISFRDWGRDCFCRYNEENPNGACNQRFNFKVNGIQVDHRYFYTHIGYNLKPTEIQCAMGVEQLKKIELFHKIRKRNFNILFKRLENYQDRLILPKTAPKSDVSWFAFPITIRDNNGINRNSIMKFLEKNKIQTRVLFTGNILKHPAYKEIEYKVASNLKNSDLIMQNTFFVGVYPGLTEDNMNYIADKICEFIS